MPRPKRTDNYFKVPPNYGNLIERMLQTQEATILDVMQVKTLTKIRNNTGLFNIVQPEYVEPNRTPKKIVRTQINAEIISKTQKQWVFKLL